MRVMAMTAPLEPAYAMFEVPRKPLPPIEARLMILDPGNSFRFSDFVAIHNLANDRVIHLRTCSARTDRVHIDVVRGELRGGDAGHGDDGSLGARIRDVRGAAKTFAADRGEVDDLRSGQ